MAGNQLNGAYYGPSIPPPKSHRRSSRHDDGCCCGCLSCICGCFRGCCGCIFNFILSIICKILTTIIIIVVILGFLFWLIVRPNVLKFTVTDASLSQFNFTNNNTLHYNLALNISIRNPNKRVGIYYDNIETLAFYKDVRFGSQTLGTFFQRHKNTSLLNPVFKGQQVVPLNSDQISEFDNEMKDGVYGIDVKVLLNVRFKLWLFKTGKVKPKVRCDLKVPLKSKNGTSLGNEFQVTDCDWDYKWRLFR
ncbi:NDR1/HIN1-like protein 10 [Cicer arietinum]|uniref:NDR1/HIN1-like protein 2 n=1 Tax=Cicer arietinum TaxID=3827 RepID=A0A1S2Y133_CICAR|nr:NDR1/HIN1-like protein 2 [Cicer arietinum]XP_004497667.1 NDR1/HIN1-like protein 2 [Cicer arietinum]XP_004513158.1 NDR1/HIN1-like protein 2 [Cicer arietinum]XP_004513159.1 NDR1/HIN1-like protein 2 [Cicer arietinum]